MMERPTVVLPTWMGLRANTPSCMGDIGEREAKGEAPATVKRVGVLPGRWGCGCLYFAGAGQVSAMGGCGGRWWV